MSFALLGAEWVLWLLVALSVLSIAIAIERAVYLVLHTTNHRALTGLLQAFVQQGDLPALTKGLGALQGTEARVLSAGANRAQQGPAASEQAMAAAAKVERLRMESRLPFLATVGANAPFIGLFGTVLGVIQAFADLGGLDGGNVGQGANAAVMSGISEALVATAVGLFVAIPAVVLYNGFKSAIKARMGRVEWATDRLLSGLNNPQAGSHGQ